MSDHEQDWLPQYLHNRPEYYRRYVYETFCLFKNKQDANNFFEYLNTRHPCIKFTMETEAKEKLPFLDVLIAKQTGSSCKTSVHHKTTYTGVLTIFFSFTAFSYKIGLIKTLTEGIFEINNWRGFQNDFEKLASTLRKNRFPQYLMKQTRKLLFKQN